MQYELLISHIRVPPSSSQLTRTVVIKHSLISVPQITQNLRMSLHVMTKGVYMESTEVAAIFLQPFRRLVDEVLVTEDEDTALGCPQCEFIFLLIGQGAELDTFDFCPDRWGHIFGLFDCAEEGLLLGVGSGPWVDVLVWL